jgi:quercetin dioxygenase-like cupin family protein
MNDYIDPVAVAPGHYRTLLENEHVRVLAMDLGPGRRDAEHSHPEETVYFLRGGRLRIHLPSGEPIEAELPDGHVMWHEAWTHSVENLGDTAISAIIVESKPRPDGR